MPDGAGEQARANRGCLLEAASTAPAATAPPLTGLAAAGRSGSSPSSVAPPALRGHPAVALFCDRWAAHYGKAPTINSKRVGILTQIYKGLGPEAAEEYPRLLDALFASDDRFIISNTHSPEVFGTKLDTLRVNGTGHAQRGAAGTVASVSGLSRAGRATMEAGMSWLKQSGGGGRS